MTSGNIIECNICPHNCRISQGRTGICGVRKNNGVEIELLTYGVISGIALDPIEKKPLYHFYPGSKILSIGSYGCNMKCDFCQNYHISQEKQFRDAARVSPDTIVKRALDAPGNIGIAYTYNEPVIWFEYVMDVAKRAALAGLRNVMITNGFVTPEVLVKYLSLTDAFNVDLKAFNSDFYRKVTGADIEPVKAGLKQIRDSGKHLEITTLIIPGLNDSLEEMDNQVKWIAGELGKETPLHLSRYYPVYRRSTPATSEEKLMELFDRATESLDYVYLGNIRSETGSATKCPVCGKIITMRSGYSVSHVSLTEGKCSGCGNPVYKYITSS